MIEINKSIWDAQFDGMCRVIPVNKDVKTDGELVMGAGLAKQAAERYYGLPFRLGESYREKGVNVGIVYLPVERLIAFPTKIHWRLCSDLKLIEAGLVELSCFKYGSVVSPRLGCGLGNLDWEHDIKPLMLKYFGDDDNFIIASL